MFRQDRVRSTLALALLVAGAVYAYSASYFGKELLAEIAVFAILAMSLDFLAGFAGLVTLGHAAFYGAGAYVYAVLTVNHGVAAGFAMLAAAAVCAIAGWLIGAVTYRVRGIFLIMATLAFGQMSYVYIFENRALGGDDGMSGVPRVDLSAVGIDLSNSANFAFTLVLIAGLTYVLFAWLLSSGFGQALVGMQRNEQRMRALGLPVLRYKAAAFAIAGAIAGMAGTLGAQHNMFVSPDYLHWTTSGLVLVLVILGGLESLAGPALGAAVVIALKHEISTYTVHWAFFIGVFLIVAVLAGGRGLYGLIDVAVRRFSRSKSPEPHDGDDRRQGDA